MIVLFVNLHQNTQEGAAKFHRYYSSVTQILKQSVYLGSQYEEQIRTRDQLKDFLYEEIDLNEEYRAR